ncbi:MAG: heme exporter protein CcmB [Alphaproteobacteria bacterium]|nr:heme exporter protein CcmB [Alphaproteobacteria bacterium]
MTNILTLLYHELRLQIRQSAEWASLVLFFIIVIVLTPFALGPDPAILSRLAPGLIWIAALLMSLLSIDRLFVQDARDGTLDMLLTSPVPLELLAFVKVFAQILAMLGALVVIVFPAALLLGLKASVLPALIATFFLGIPTLGLLGGIAGAITIGLARNAALITLLLAPLFIPVLIFAVSACDAASMGAPYAQPLLFMAAIEALLLSAAPFIIAAALRGGQG